MIGSSAIAVFRVSHMCYAGVQWVSDSVCLPCAGVCRAWPWSLHPMCCRSAVITAFYVPQVYRDHCILCAAGVPWPLHPMCCKCAVTTAFYVSHECGDYSILCAAGVPWPLHSMCRRCAVTTASYALHVPWPLYPMCRRCAVPTASYVPQVCRDYVITTLGRWQATTWQESEACVALLYSLGEAVPTHHGNHFTGPFQVTCSN